MTDAIGFALDANTDLQRGYRSSCVEDDSEADDGRWTQACFEDGGGPDAWPVRFAEKDIIQDAATSWELLSIPDSMSSTRDHARMERTVRGGRESQPISRTERIDQRQGHTESMGGQGAEMDAENGIRSGQNGRCTSSGLNSKDFLQRLTPSTRTPPSHHVQFSLINVSDATGIESSKFHACPPCHSLPSRANLVGQVLKWGFQGIKLRRRQSSVLS
jgi:hypothetical protein